LRLSRLLLVWKNDAFARVPQGLLDAEGSSMIKAKADGMLFVITVRMGFDKAYSCLARIRTL